MFICSSVHLFICSFVLLYIYHPWINIADTLQLFLPIFPDSEVRRRAVEWLEEETTDRKQNQTNQSVLKVAVKQLKGNVSIISSDSPVKMFNGILETLIVSKMWKITHKSYKFLVLNISKEYATGSYFNREPSNKNKTV